MQGTIWQSLLDYARSAWDTMLKEFKKAATYDKCACHIQHGVGR